MQTKVEFCKGLMGRLGSGVVYSSAVMPHVILSHGGLWIFPGGFCVQPWPELTHSTVNTTQLKLQHKESPVFILSVVLQKGELTFILEVGLFPLWRGSSPLFGLAAQMSDRFVKIIRCIKISFIEAAFEKLIGSQQQRERILWTSNLPPLGAARKQLLWSRSHSWRFDKQWGEVGWRAEGGGARWRWWWRRADEAELVE